MKINAQVRQISGDRFNGVWEEGVHRKELAIVAVGIERAERIHEPGVEGCARYGLQPIPPALQTKVQCYTC